MARVVGGLEAPFYKFESNNVEFKKFKNVFVQYAAKDGERDKQLRHFFDAYDRVRNEYVYAIEDDILITQTGNKNLSAQFPREIEEIEKILQK